MTAVELLTPMMQQYITIKKQHPDSLLFYRLGDFFELFFEDAIIASRELDITLTKRGRKNGKDVPMCGVPAHSYEIYLAKLIQKGYRVVICDQTETPEEAKKRGAKGPLSRDITRIVTSGTLTEDGLLTAEHNYIMALSLLAKNKKSLAIAIADISTGFFGLEEIVVNDLGNVIARWHPSEIIISDDTFANPLWSHLFEIWKKYLTVFPKARFNETNAEYLLKSIYNVPTLDVFGHLSTLTIQAAGILIDYIMTTQCCRTLSLSTPQLICSQDFLSIDASTRRNLELVNSSSEQKNSSLFAVINKTVTAMGRRLLLEWLSAPLLDIEKIEKRLNDIEIFIKNTKFREKMRECLQNLPDIDRIISRIILGRTSPKDLGALKLALDKAKTIQKELYTYEFFLTSFSINDELLFLDKELTQALKNELPVLAREGNFIKDGYDSSLDKMRDLHSHVSENLQNLQSQYIQQTGIHNLKIRRNNVWGIYIEVSSSQIPKIPFDFIHRQTLTNCARYTTSELIDLEQKINQSENTALNRELELFEIIIQQILKKREEFRFLSEILAYLDVIAAGADLAIRNKYVRPQFSTQPLLQIIEGRHPVIEQSFQNQDLSFTVNDCLIDKEKRRFLLVTGPNMAGKSTYLRQNALIIIMAQMGYFVPAKRAFIGIVDQIFSRIGASDDLASGRSTFMMEMIETAAILHQATPRSFVILDEIGRGTATYDGLSIAWSVSEYLYQNIQCRTLFATHYHELTKLSDNFKAIVLITAATREWEDKIIFLHKIIEGCSQKSYGIHVAQLAGLPKAVIHRAAELLNSFEQEMPLRAKSEKLSVKNTHSSQKELF